MILCFECRAETKRKLDSLLEYGDYSDYSEVLVVAVDNLLILQQQIQQSGSIILGPARSHETGIGNTSSRPQGQLTVQTTSPVKRDPPSLVDIPDLFRLPADPRVPFGLVPPPDEMWALGQEIPLDRWLFGQYNRLLPAKASCRALVNLCLARGEPPLLGDVAQHIASQAAHFRVYLAQLDDLNHTPRDRALATAFPQLGTEGDKSRLRYASQFVASVNTHGQISGLLVDLKLANTSARKPHRLHLTQAGWHFALLENPVLDLRQTQSPPKFSEGERSELLTHISSQVPVEDFAYRTILAAILDGQNTPDSIDHRLSECAPPQGGNSRSQSFLSSQRSGAISRMSDLDLVIRNRTGVRVEYQATASGKMYLQTRQY